MENQIPKAFLEYVENNDESTFKVFQLCTNPKNFGMEITMEDIKSGKFNSGKNGHISGPLDVETGKEIDLYELVKKLHKLYEEYKRQTISGGKRRKSRRNRKSKKTRKSRNNRRKSRRRSRR